MPPDGRRRTPADPLRLPPFFYDRLSSPAADAVPPAAGSVPEAHHPPAASYLRPYLLTGGRTLPVDATLDIEAQVVSTRLGRDAADWHEYEHRDILRLCERPVSVAEVAALLGLHLGVARVLVGDLVALGHLDARRPPADLRHDAEIIERVIRGVEAIR